MGCLRCNADWALFSVPSHQHRQMQTRSLHLGHEVLDPRDAISGLTARRPIYQQELTAQTIDTHRLRLKALPTPEFTSAMYFRTFSLSSSDMSLLNLLAAAAKNEHLGLGLTSSVVVTYVLYILSMMTLISVRKSCFTAFSYVINFPSSFSSPLGFRGFEDFPAPLLSNRLLLLNQLIQL